MRILLGPNGHRSGKAPQKSKKRAHTYPRHLGLSSGINITFLGGIIQSQHLNGQSLFTALYQLNPFILASQEQVTPNRNCYQWEAPKPKLQTAPHVLACGPVITKIFYKSSILMMPPQHTYPTRDGSPRARTAEPKASAWLLPPNQTLPSRQHNSLAFHKVRLL